MPQKLMLPVMCNSIYREWEKLSHKNDIFSFNFIRLEFERQQREELEKLESKR
jgi:hypothetical protein